MNVKQLSLADYNKIDNIPVINQDLSASGFTPVANTYYRHTGATTDTFTQGVIYLYDTAYHKLGESGGTTLNKYTTQLGVTNSDIKHLIRILQNAKSIISFSGTRLSARLALQLNSQTAVNYLIISGINIQTASTLLYKETIDVQAGSRSDSLTYIIKTTEITTDSSTFLSQYTIEYYNDVEIT